jgi:hypothetical protein
MAQWIQNGLIGWGTVVAVGVGVSLVTRAPYTLPATVAYMLGVGLLGIPGGILVGLRLHGWFWSAIGGLVSAAVLYYAVAAILGRG